MFHTLPPEIHPITLISSSVFKVVVGILDPNAHGRIAITGSMVSSFSSHSLACLMHPVIRLVAARSLNMGLHIKPSLCFLVVSWVCF